MKLTAFLLFAVCLQVAARTEGQKVTLTVKNAPMKKVFREIQKQTGLNVLVNENILDKAGKVTLEVRNMPVSDVLNLCFRNEQLSYSIIDGTIVVAAKPAPAPTAPLQEPGNLLPPLIDFHGHITDSAGNPLVGASVIVKGTKRGTSTDVNGNFELNDVKNNAILVISFSGYANKEYEVNGQIFVNIKLMRSTNPMDEIIVIGYGSQRRADLLGAVSSINSSEIANIPTSNLSNVLAGRLSGTYVETNTGTPGISSSIRIRAQSSWNGGDPVYVIDGVVRDKTSFDALGPNEVDQITILKDAASAAIYGSRSSNGVILVTTKSGKAGKPLISFSSSFTQQKVGKVPGYMGVPESIALDRYTYGDSSVTAADYASLMKNNPDGKEWYNLAYQTPKSQQYALSASGGGDRFTYYIGGSYYDENGFLPNVWYKKLNLRGNLSAKLTKDLTVGLNLSESNGTRNRFNFTYDYGSADLNNLWGKLFYNAGFTQPYVDGKPVNPGWLGNQIEMMRNGGYWRNTNQQTDALINIEYKIPFVPGLSVKASYSRNFDNSYVKNFAKKQLLYNYAFIGNNGTIDPNQPLGTTLSGDPGTEYLGNEFTKTDAYQLNGQINYDRYFGKSHVSAVGVYEQYEYQYNYFSMYHYNFPLFPTDQFFATSGNPSDWKTAGNESQDARLSYVGRVNYEYDKRYLFSASVREDGSIKFAPNKRWGLFPSVSAGWIISNENFFKASNTFSNIFDMMKLRASFGSTGNDIIGGWQWQDQYNIQGSYYLGNPGIVAPGLTYGGIPNPDITWEKSNSYNFGLDLNFLKNFSLSTDLWTRHTYDILGPRILALPVEFGGTLPAVNYGIVNGKGLEIELGYRNKIGRSFSYSIKGNFGLAENTVIKRDAPANAQPVDDPNGKTLGYLKGLVSTGIYRTQDELDKLPAGYTIYGQAPVLGMLSFRDVSGPGGVPDGKIDDYDRSKLANYGQGQAPISYGINLNLEYKGFSVSMLFAGLSGFKTFYNDAFSRNIGVYATHTSWWNDYWTETNVNGKAPKPFPWGDSRADYQYNSTYNLYDAGFLRMKYLNLSYSLPAKMMGRLGIHSVQFFASGTNLFVISKFKYYDPEVTQFMSYPIQKTFTLGFNVNL
ncbi:MAG: TonB-dependent receptor [Chitinophagales bacterium]